MASSVQIRLLFGLLAVASASFAFAQDLRAPETFSSITNTAERSRALFAEAGRVLQHPRCLNCHPVGERPTQGNDCHPHSPLVVRGADDKGAIGHALHDLPPGCELRAVGRAGTSALACRAEVDGMADRNRWARSASRSRIRGATAARRSRRSRSTWRTTRLVGWAWMPGGNREPAPGTQAQLGALIAAWIESGAACPAA